MKASICPLLAVALLFGLAGVALAALGISYASPNSGDTEVKNLAWFTDNPVHCTATVLVYVKRGGNIIWSEYLTNQPINKEAYDHTLGVTLQSGDEVYVCVSWLDQYNNLDDFRDNMTTVP